MTVAASVPTSPIPTVLKAAKTLGEFRRDPLGLFTRIAALPQGMARARLLGKDLIFITHPDHVHHVVRNNYQNYDKNAPMYKNARPFLGNGLTVAVGGEDWLHRRRLMQPAFHRNNVHVVCDVTMRCLAETLAERERLEASGEPFDVSVEMTRLTMRVTSQTFFGIDLLRESEEMARRLDGITAFATRYLSRPFPPLWVPTPAIRRFHSDIDYVNEFVEDVVRTRQADPDEHSDLLNLLVGAAGDGSGGGLSRQQLRDELIGFFFAGHETLAHSMSWCWYLLARDPRADAELAAELDRALAGRAPTLEDIPNLTYTRMVIDEAMRLYPALWVNMRRALGEDVIGGHRIPAGAIVSWSPFAGNRFPEVWDDADDFRPERFTPEQSAQRSRHAATPFGEGPRACIGSGFATAEATLILATLAQRHRLRLVDDAPAEPAVGFTIYPKDGVWATLSKRGA